jgi:hypothetical protein
LSCQMAVLQGNGEGQGIQLYFPAPSPRQHLGPSPSISHSGSERTCCPINWVELEGSCYWFSHSAKPWPEADKYCQLENAHLVVVTSWEEQVRPW